MIDALKFASIITIIALGLIGNAALIMFLVSNVASIVGFGYGIFSVSFIAYYAATYATFKGELK